MSEKLSVLNKNWYEKGVSFKCTSCGKCCTGSGYVSLSENEAKDIAKYLELSFEKFLSLYCIKSMGKHLLKDLPGTDHCIFLKEKKCSIYDHRPTQCKTFPYWPSIMRSKQNWEIEARHCEGINHPEADLINKDVIEKNLKLMEER